MKNRIRSRKALYKYFTSYVLLITVLLASIAFSVNKNIADKMEGELSRENERSLNILQDKIEDTILKPACDISLSYAVNSVMNSNSDLSLLMDKGYFNHLYNACLLNKNLNSVIIQNAYISSIDIYFTNREFVVSSSGFYETVDGKPRRELFGILRKTSVGELKQRWLVTREYRANNTYKEIYTYIDVFPYAASDATKKGFVCINIYKDTLVGIVRDMIPSPNDSLFILDPEGNFLLSYNENANSGSCDSIRESLLKQKLSGGYDPVSLIKSQPSDQIRLFSARSKAYRWSLLQISHWSEIIRASTEMKRTILAILAVILSVGILISWFLSKQNYLPVQRILSSLASGLRVSPRDEFVYIDSQIKMLKGRASLLSEELGKNICFSLLFGRTGQEIPGEIEKLFQYDNFVVVVLRANYRDTAEEYDRRKLLTDRLGEKFSLKSLPLGKGCYALILNGGGEDGMSEASVKENLSGLAERFGLKFTFGIGNRVDSLDRLYESYENAGKALRYEFLRGYNAIISCREIGGKNGGADPINVKRFAGYVRDGRKDKVGEMLGQLRVSLIKYDCSIEKAECIFFDLISSLNEIILSAGIYNEFLGYKDLYHIFLSKRTVFEAIDWLGDISENMISMMEIKSSNVKNELMVKLKEYINGHLYEDLSLTRLSQIVFLNPTYLSTQFKQTYGIGVLEYINEERLEKAKDMLLKGDKTVEEIARMVGFSSTAYFIKKFKSRNGLTPKNFTIKEAADHMQGMNAAVRRE